MELKNRFFEFKERKTKLICQKDSIDVEITKLCSNIADELKALKGKYFNGTKRICTRCVKVNPKVAEYKWSDRSDIDKLFDVCQVLDVTNESVYLQIYSENIREVTPKDRLTFECRYISIPLEQFFHRYFEEISLSVFINTLKAMQERDSYSCWHTTILL